MPVVRVRFKSTNGRVREGNVLIDSGAGTRDIRKGFAKSLGLQGHKERINIAVVGGKILRRKTVNESSFGYPHFMESYPIEAHELGSNYHQRPGP